MRPFFVGLCGISGAGKSTLADHLESQGGIKRFRFDAYYKTEADCPKLPNGKANWDLPESLYLEEVYEALLLLREGQDILLPTYNRRLCDRTGAVLFKPAPILFIEGLQLFADPQIRSLIDLRLWLDVSEEEAARRRVQRQPDYDLAYHWSVAVPQHRSHVMPHRKHAHAMINGHDSVPNVVRQADTLLYRFLREQRDES